MSNFLYCKSKRKGNLNINSKEYGPYESVDLPTFSADEKHWAFLFSQSSQYKKKTSAGRDYKDVLNFNFLKIANKEYLVWLSLEGKSIYLNRKKL